MSVVLALLIGAVAGADMDVLSDPVANLAPDAREQRRRPDRRASDDETAGTMSSGTVTIERRIIIRIPMVEMRSSAAPSAGVPASSAAIPPREACLSMRSIRGASIHEKAGLLFVTNSNNRYQATLERGCRPVDFQSGFYLSPSSDGALCAGRDRLHARSGARCVIVGLTRLGGM